MPHRSPQNVPRLSGRPTTAQPSAERENQTVFRRFFDLIERLEKPRSAPVNKATSPTRTRR